MFPKVDPKAGKEGLVAIASGSGQHKVGIGNQTIKRTEVKLLGELWGANVRDFNLRESVEI